MSYHATTRSLIIVSPLIYGRTQIGDSATKLGANTGLLLQPEEGSTIVDTNSSAITVIIKGKEITRTIVDGGFGVNVISQRTCDNMGIT